jgi:hypothetical protein
MKKIIEHLKKPELLIAVAFLFYALMMMLNL